jgi:hypothetical protein
MESALTPSTDEILKKMWYVYSGVLFSHKEEWNYVAWREIDCTGDHSKQNKPDSEGQRLDVFFHMWNLDPKSVCVCVCGCMGVCVYA